MSLGLNSNNVPNYMYNYTGKSILAQIEEEAKKGPSSNETRKEIKVNKESKETKESKEAKAKEGKGFVMDSKAASLAVDGKDVKAGASKDTSSFNTTNGRAFANALDASGMAAVNNVFSSVAVSLVQPNTVNPLVSSNNSNVNTASVGDKQFAFIPKAIPKAATHFSPDVENLFTGGDISSVLVLLLEKVNQTFLNFTNNITTMSELYNTFSASAWNLYTEKATAMANAQRKKAVEADKAARERAAQAGACALGGGIGEAILGAILAVVAIALAPETGGASLASFAVGISVAVGVTTGIVMAADGVMKAMAGAELMNKAFSAASINNLVNSLQSQMNFGVFSIFSDPAQAELIFNVTTAILGLGSSAAELWAANGVKAAAKEGAAEAAAQINTNFVSKTIAGLGKMVAPLTNPIMEFGSTALKSISTGLKSMGSRISTFASEVAGTLGETAVGRVAGQGKSAVQNILNDIAESISKVGNSVGKTLTMPEFMNKFFKSVFTPNVIKTIITLNYGVEATGMILNAAQPGGKDNAEMAKLFQAMSAGFVTLATAYPISLATTGKLGTEGQAALDSILYLASGLAASLIEMRLRSGLPEMEMSEGLRNAMARMGVTQLVLQSAKMATQSVEGLFLSLMSVEQEKGNAEHQKVSSELMVLKEYIQAVMQNAQQQGQKYNSLLTQAAQGFEHSISAVTTAINNQGKAVQKLLA